MGRPPLLPLVPGAELLCHLRTGDWHSGPPKEVAQPLFPNLFPTPASSGSFPLAKLDSLYGKRKEKPLGPECKTTVKKSPCVYEVCDSVFHHVSQRDSQLFYLLSPLLPSHPLPAPRLCQRSPALPRAPPTLCVPVPLSFIILCSCFLYLFYWALDSLKE